MEQKTYKLQMSTVWHPKGYDLSSDPDSSLSVNEVMDFYSMTYPELTTATVHGPEWEEDKAVYRFKTTIGVKG